MPHVPARRTPIASRLLLAIAATIPLAGHAGSAAASTPPPDAAYFTSYSMGVDDATVNWIVCGGSTAATKGCHGSGILGTFGHAASLVEGQPAVDLANGTVTRDIYVCDVAAASDRAHVRLYDYRKTDVVSASGDATSVALAKSVSLPLTGGAGASCFMAANSRFLFLGTDKGTPVAIVTKGTLHVRTDIGMDIPISSMTADAYGYAQATFNDNGFEGFGPEGQGSFEGGGVQFKVGTKMGLTNRNLPHSFHDFAVSAGRVEAGLRNVATTMVAGADATAPDSGLWTDYYPSNQFNSFEFVVCGAIGGTHTCFDPVIAGTAGYAAAIIEGSKKTNATTGAITRDLYICGGTSTGVSLYVYERSDAITGANDAITVKLLKTLPLPLPVPLTGTTSACMIAANDKDLFIGTNQNTSVVRVAKNGYAIKSFSAHDTTMKLAAITTDQYGFMNAAFGSAGGATWVDQFTPSGSLARSVAGPYFMLNTTQSQQTGLLPTMDAAAFAAWMDARSGKATP